MKAHTLNIKFYTLLLTLSFLLYTVVIGNFAAAAITGLLVLTTMHTSRD